MLEVRELHVKIGNVLLLKGVNLCIRRGEIHVIMGPNGAGKSTLASVLAGHPSYEVTEGDILIDGKSILDLEPEERALQGLFMGFQYPPEIPGVSNFQFLFHAYNALKKGRGQPLLSEEAFSAFLAEKMLEVEMRPEFRSRELNEGFSGGEKKRNEILQMAVLDPTYAILDETDSGLDIDALRIVARGVNRLMTPEKGLLLITHYQRLLDLITPHYVHVMVGGRLVQTGGKELALLLEKQGYEGIAQ